MRQSEIVCPDVVIPIIVVIPNRFLQEQGGFGFAEATGRYWKHVCPTSGKSGCRRWRRYNQGMPSCTVEGCSRPAYVEALLYDVYLEIPEVKMERDIS
jgi:hypothetical protein